MTETGLQGLWCTRAAWPAWQARRAWPLQEVCEPGCALPTLGTGCWQRALHLLQPGGRALRQPCRHCLEQQQVVLLARQAAVDARLGLRHGGGGRHEALATLLHVLRQLQRAPARRGAARQLQRRGLCGGEQLRGRDDIVDQANGQAILRGDGLPAEH